MKHIKEYKTHTSIDTPNSREAKKLNKIYDWEAVPKKDRYTQKHYNHLNTFQIGIGEAKPVQKFQKWNKNYWETSNDTKQRKKRQKKGASIANSSVQA